MATNAVIGALRVVIGADSAALDKGLKDAGDSMRAFGARMEKVGAVAGAAISAAFVGIGLAIKGSLESADKLNKLSQTIGVPVEELSKLKYAADLSDVSLESLATSLGRLSKNMVAFAADSTSEAGAGLRALGIDVKNADGSLKSSSTVLGEIAEKFSGYKDGAEKTALAINLFGRAGAAMIPLLNGGKEAIQSAATEAEQLGIVLTDKTAVAAENFNDNLRRLTAVKEGLVTKITADLAPALKVLSDRLVEGAKNSNLLGEAAGWIVTGIKAVTTEILTTIVSIQRLGAELSALAAIFTAGSWQGIKDAWAAFSAEGVKTEGILKSLKGQIAGFWADADKAAVEGAKSTKDNSEKVAAPIIQSVEKIKDAAKAMEGFFAGIAKRQAALQAEAQTLGKSVAEQEKLKLVMEGEALARSKNIVLTDALRAKIEASATAYANVAQKTDEAKKAYERIVEVGNAVQSSLENAFVGAITGANSLKDTVKSLIGEFAKLAAQVAFKSIMGNIGGGNGLGGLFGSMFGGGGGGGGSGSAGSINVGNYSMPKFANGGAFNVGGAGGIDSQMVAFKASPNERVSVTKPGQGAGGVVMQDNRTIHIGQGASQETVAQLKLALAQDRAGRYRETVGIVAQARKRREL